LASGIVSAPFSSEVRTHNCKLGHPKEEKGDYRGEKRQAGLMCEQNGDKMIGGIQEAKGRKASSGRTKIRKNHATSDFRNGRLSTTKAKHVNQRPAKLTPMLPPILD